MASSGSGPYQLDHRNYCKHGNYTLVIPCEKCVLEQENDALRARLAEAIEVAREYQGMIASASSVFDDAGRRHGEPDDDWAQRTRWLTERQQQWADQRRVLRARLDEIEKGESDDRFRY